MRPQRSMLVALIPLMALAALDAGCAADAPSTSGEFAEGALDPSEVPWATCKTEKSAAAIRLVTRDKTVIGITGYLFDQDASLGSPAKPFKLAIVRKSATAKEVIVASPPGADQEVSVKAFRVATTDREFSGAMLPLGETKEMSISYESGGAYSKVKTVTAEGCTFRNAQLLTAFAAAAVPQK
jgi:hypothetical protein